MDRWQVADLIVEKTGTVFDFDYDDEDEGVIYLTDKDGYDFKVTVESIGNIKDKNK